MKKEHAKSAFKVLSTADMLTHPWILSAESENNVNGGVTKKKKTQIQIKGEYSSTASVASNANGGSMNVKLTLKELLNVSSDWKEVNKKNPAGGAAAVFSGGLPMDF